ncbi:MAG: class I SAM-dependent methyltransferase [Acidobacteriota bacterium]|nr:class I SAM-dependent methyltransferase [Acidobacteriota bacterium]
MDRRTQLALNRINARFYQRQAEHFSATRSRPWPGWRTLLERWWLPEPPIAEASVLDVGCGNGRFVEAVGQSLAGSSEPLDWSYRGLDASTELLDHARRRLQALASGPRWSLGRWDLVTAAWPGAMLTPPAGMGGWSAGPDRRQYSLVVAFGLLHHVPGFELRRRLLACLGRRVAPGGTLAVSFWCFGELQRFQRRRVPWSELSQEHSLGPASTDSLEEGDWLLRWGDGDALRYCHAASAAEIDALAAAPGLPLCDDFRADGAGGILNRYLVWRRASVG